MKNMEEVAVSEVRTPVAAAVAAALGPKIEKIKAWSKDRELEIDIKEENLPKIFREYLENLSSRISEITSIAFPQKKLPIELAYEPLTLRQSTPYSQTEVRDITIDGIIENKNNNLIIIDNAGMGKTTFSKYIVSKLLFKSERIPLFFELRQIESKDSLIESLASEMDIPGKRFNRELFYKLMAKGKFYVILDGFDEVKLDLQSDVANEIQKLSEKGGKNLLVLTSRPQQTLPEISNSKPLEFLPFTEEQTISMLARYDKISGLDVGSRLKKEIDKIPDKLMESPLLVSLLYRTFGVNNSIAERTSTFYDEIYDALFKGHDLANKNSYTREKKSGLDFEDFRKLLRSLCYYMTLSGITSLKNLSQGLDCIKQAERMSSISPSSASNFFDDLQVSVPLIQKDGNEYRFLHKTILEYFAAEYIISSSNSGELTRKIFNSKASGAFSQVFRFIADINPKLYHSTITKQIAEKLEKDNIGGSEGARELATAKAHLHLKVGLWETKGNSMKLKQSKRIVPASEILNMENYMHAIWRRGKINGKSHYIVLFMSINDANIPLEALDELCESSVHPMNNKKTNTTLDGYKLLVGIGQARELTSEIIENKSVDNSLLREMIREVLTISVSDGIVMIDSLSPTKIKEFLASQNEQNEVEKELEQLLTNRKFGEGMNDMDWS